jgi:hypothetical protein
MTFKYANLTKLFIESRPMSENFIAKELSIFLSRKFRRKISVQKSANLLDGCEDCIPTVEDKRGRRQWKRVI